MIDPRGIRLGWFFAVALAAAPGAARAAGVDSLATGRAGWRVSLPDEAVREIPIHQDWSGVGRLAFTVRADPPPERPLRLMVTLVVWNGWWYQSAQPVSLAGSEERRVELDLGQLSNDWSPCGHLRAWDGYARQRVRSLAVRVFSETPYEGTIHVTSVALEPLNPAGEPKLFLYDADVVTDAPRVGRPVVVSFRLSKVYRNPFERGLVWASLERAGRAVASAPAYFYQDFREAKDGRLKPVGASAWRAHLAAPAAGRYRWVVRARDGGNIRTLVGGVVRVGPARRIAASPRPPATVLEERTPFVLSRRVSRRTPVFELVGGRWKWTTERHEEPILRAWRVPLEWTRRWGGFQGLGRYSLENAWRFDRLLEEAELEGVSLPLALNSGEPFQGHGTYNWFSNPLAAHMGGPLRAPSDYFTNPVARRLFEQQVHYILSRWAGSPAVSRFELWMSVPANHAEAWHEKTGAFLARAPRWGKPVVSRHPQGAVLGKRRRITGFERQWTGWQAAHRISRSTRIEYAGDRVSQGSRSLKVTAGFPGEAAVYSDVNESWNGYGRLTFDVYVPKGAPNDMRAMVYVRERDWWWYETLCESLLRPGDWTKLIVDISPESTAWKPRSHRRRWDGYVAQNIRQMGIRIFGHRPYRGPVYIDNLTLWPDPRHPRPVRVLDLTANRSRVGQYELYELTFRLNRVFPNPFDPQVADIRGHFVSPSGRHVEVPGFFHQGYERKLVNGVERLVAAGRSSWKVRFAAGETGRWTATIKVNGKEYLRDRPVRFEVVPSKNPGYVRRSLRDPRYLEFTSGRFFYPIGHTLRSPSDGRRPYPFPFKTPEGMGTFIYDEYFKKMAAAGENMARIWMCSWWCGLEWNARWRGYGGIGRYNMENAWRLDHLVAQAARRGIYIALDTTNHGQYSTNIDHEWEHNPYNIANGGFLRHAYEFFTDPRAMRKYKDRMRYTIARWGYSPNILMWTLFSEVEFVEEYWRYTRHNASYFSPHVGAWHSRMAKYIRSIDPFGHLVTTHVSHPWRGRDIWMRPEMSVVQSNAYSKYPQLGKVDVVRTLSKVYHDYLKRYRRPVLVAEYGGHWMHNSPDTLDAELHAGVWATAMMPYAGNTGFWWWLHVHFADKYRHYRAFANYMKGEDRRGRNLVQANLLVTSKGDVLKVVGLQNTTSAYAWVYHRRVPVTLKGIPRVSGASLAFAGLIDGTYRVEFWDTYRGVKTETVRTRCTNGQMTLPLPPVHRDLALKVHIEEAAHTSP